MADFKEILRCEAQKSSIPLDPDKIQQLDTFRCLLLEKNKYINLTNITEDEDFARKHIIDSLIITKHVSIPYGAKVADIGTGAGIPGLILKIYRPDIKLLLVESIRKKTDFLEDVVKKMNISDVHVVNKRAEEAGHSAIYREKYDIVTARAVSSLNTLVEICLPFAKIGGVFLALKGTEPEEEIDAAQNAINILGGKLTAYHKYSLDGISYRSLLVISKVKNSPEKYPRSPAAIKKKPL